MTAKEVSKVLSTKVAFMMDGTIQIFEATTEPIECVGQWWEFVDKKTSSTNIICYGELEHEVENGYCKDWNKGYWNKGKFVKVIISE